VLMAAGLAMTSGPATDAVMGALPRSRAGAGSAVNDTTREIGGTLGVAVVGSALTSVYGPHVASALRDLALPESVVSQARESIMAAGQVVAGLPASVQASAGTGVRQAFLDGLSAGSYVAAAVTMLGAIAVVIFLPARQADPTVADPMIERLTVADPAIDLAGSAEAVAVTRL
jgi:DHA2 family multidrug resistance protein-like MFS transporter